jgi:hypothetical protein
MRLKVQQAVLELFDRHSLISPKNLGLDTPGVGFLRASGFHAGFCRLEAYPDRNRVGA